MTNQPKPLTREIAFSPGQALLDNRDGRYHSIVPTNFAQSSRDCDGDDHLNQEMIKDDDNDGLCPPALLTIGEVVKGMVRNQHCKENKQLQRDDHLNQEMTKDDDNDRLCPPALLTIGEAVKGKARNQHCKENKQLAMIPTVTTTTMYVLVDTPRSNRPFIR
jgi:hypothetical protein